MKSILSLHVDVGSDKAKGFSLAFLGCGTTEGGLLPCWGQAYLLAWQVDSQQWKGWRSSNRKI